MNTPSVDIKDMLQDDSSLNLTYKDNLFIGLAPADVDNCVTVIDTPGAGPNTGMNYGDYYYTSVQIQVRDNDYLNAMNLAHDIMVSLHLRADETWSSTYYTLIQCVNDPTNLGPDGNDRSIAVLNFDIQRR